MLFSALKDMESKGDLTGDNLQKGLSVFLDQNKTSQAKEYKPKERMHNEIVLRVLATLGDPHVCGLTEIELFDDKA